MERSESSRQSRIAALAPEKRDQLLRRLGMSAARSPESVGIVRREGPGPHPLSFAQRRLWFMEQFQPGTAFYNIAAGLRLSGEADELALAHSIGQIIERHEVLRSRFVVEADEPVQYIDPPPVGFQLPTIEVTGGSAEERRREAERLAAEESRRPFDLAGGLLLRAKLLRMGERERILLLTIHHLAGDGWSTGIFLRELAAGYLAGMTGQADGLADLPIRYADYAYWQRERWERGDLKATQIEAARKRLGEGSGEAELPTDRPRPPVQTTSGALLEVALPPELQAQVTALAHEEGVTPFEVTCAAFEALIHRYTGAEDLRLGVPVANRRRVEVEGLIGFFVNTLVLRGDFSGEPDFRTLLRRVHRDWLAAEECQDLPFELLVETLQPERQLSRSPLFEVMFAWQQPAQMPRLPGLEVEPLEIGTGTAKFDLMLTVEPGFGQYAGWRTLWEYNTDLFDRETIERMSGHFRVLLAACLAEPEQPIARLPLLTLAEREQLLVEWNRTLLPVKRDALFPRLFAEQAARQPKAPAVACGDQSLSFGELNERANRLAWRLRRLGVGPESLVALFTERSIETMVGLIAILKAGGALLPLDPAYPAERVNWILGQSGAAVVLTQERLAERLGEPADGLNSPPVVRLDADWAEIARERADEPPTVIDEHSLAYVIYTSGSTGRPKGVMVEHGSLANLAAGLDDGIYRRLLPDEQTGLRLSLNAPLMFDASVKQWVMLAHGHSLRIVPEDLRSDAEGLLAFIRRHQLDVLDCVPSQLKALIEEGLLAESEWVPRLVLAGGEAIDEALWHKLAGFSRTWFCNVYGPTECTVDATACVVRAHPEGPTIGRPLANHRVYILDRWQQPVPTGIPGEVFIGGAGVARGYLGRPDLTAERFIPDPFSDTPGARLYRTGDLARYRRDGMIEYLGRIDEQVKLRGYRIEPGEIESVLREYPEIFDAAVGSSRPLSRAGEEGLLTAWYVAKEGVAVDDRRLVAWLRERLPEYMVPSLFAGLESLPRLPNGKLDRRALPVPTDARTASPEDREPRTPTEELLTGIWAGLPGITRPGRHDNFFHLGGHSLLATRMVSRVRQTFGVELPLRVIFEAPTIAELATRIDLMRAGGVRSAIGSPVPVSREGDLPLSFAQQRLWFFDQFESGSALYNIHYAVRFDGPLDGEALGRALGGVMRRHEVLRSSIITIDGQPKLRITGELAAPLVVDDLRGLTDSERDEAWRRISREEAARPFDLATPPLVRLRLLAMADECHVALLTLHHLVSDGWSKEILIDELAECYRAELAGERPRLPDLPIQYVDYAAWQRRLLQGETWEQLVAFWRDRLGDGLEPLELPTDRPRPSRRTDNGATVRFTVAAALAGRVESLARSERVTGFMVLLAVFQTLLHRYSGEERICVGTPIAHRQQAEIEPLIGFFVNTLALRTDLGGQPSFRELLRRVREVTLDGYAHQEMPFDRLVDLLGVERQLSHSPVFQTMFSLQHSSVRSAETATDFAGGVRMTPLDAESRVAPFDLTLTMVGDDRGLTGEMEYSTDIFDRETIERTIGHYLRLLEALVSDPDLTIDAVSLLDEQEQRRVLWDWNPVATGLPLDHCMHELIEQQAALRPEAVAITWRGETLSYGELDRQAERLAWRLRKTGLGPERLVGICLDRSPLLIVAILAAWKAGGAYVPLDPEYPEGRIATILDEARVVATIVDRATMAKAGGLLVRIDDESPSDEPETDDGGRRLASGATPGNLACTIFTSGSTGRPKGVMVEHRSLLNTLHGWQQAYGLEGFHSYLGIASVTFDVFLGDFLRPLCTGGKLVLCPRETVFSPEELYGLVEREQVDYLEVVPAVMRALADYLEESDRRLDGLKMLVCGADTWSVGEYRRFQRLCGAGTRVINSYGVTEAAIDNTWFEGEPQGFSAEEAVPLGRALPDQRLYVLDGAMMPQPVGIPGELWIGGASVARGYLGNAELTVERFVEWEVDGGRIYRTGDLARWRADGTLQFLGRRDRQVKLRGYRIEPGEIEAALSDDPGVAQAVVNPHVDERGAKRLVAYVVAPSGGDLDLDAVQRRIRGRLPEYMVPAAWMVIDQLPVSPHGKIDRRRLPSPVFVAASAGAEVESSADPKTEALRRIWMEVLGLDRVGLDDNFFEIGGDSIISIQVVSRARRAGISLRPRDLFEKPTVRGLAAIAGSAPVIEAEQGLVTGEVPLTPVQRWFFAMDQPVPSHWNQAVMLEVCRPLDEVVARRAFEHLLRHHDALRMRFERVADGQWRARIAGEEAAVAGSSFRRIDLSAIDRSEQPAIIAAEVAAAQTGLDLGRGPLARMLLFDRGVESGRILLVIHHLVVDGVSWRILTEDLRTVCEQLSTGQPVALPSKTTSFRRWAELLIDFAASERVERQLTWWTTPGAGQPGRLPRDFVDGSLAEAALGTVRIAFGSDETESLLRVVPQAFGTEINDTLLTALALTLRDATGSAGVLIDLEGHGREEIDRPTDLSRTVGWFTTQFPIRLETAGAQTIGDLLKRVKDELRRLPDHGLGYTLLRYQSPREEVRAALRAQPSAEVLFNYLGRFGQEQARARERGVDDWLRLSRDPVGLSRSPAGRRSHLIEINGGVVDECLEMEWSYSTLVHRRETIERLAAGFQRHLRELIAYCTRPDVGGYTPSDFPDADLSEDQLESLLKEIDLDE